MSSSSAIIIAGRGAVSAAGWGSDDLAGAVLNGTVIPTKRACRTGSRLSTATRPVPPPPPSQTVLRHPRLRRSSPVSKFSAAAALEALGDERAEGVREGSYRLGIVFTFMNGCVNYSNRFFGEALADPALASPILFPETVFNAPASHLAALLGSRGPAFTLVGDSAQFIGGMDLGIQWLMDGRVEGVLVVGGEELDWLSSEAARLFSRDAVVSEGAGALLLEKGAGMASGTRVHGLVPGLTYAPGRPRKAAWEELRRALFQGTQGEGPEEGDAVFDAHSPSPAAAEGPRLDAILGDALGAALALQCVLAVALLEGEACRRAFVLHAGSNQQAAGASFVQVWAPADEAD